MTQILALSPYPHKTLYPAFTHLLKELSVSGHSVTFACPGICDEAVKSGIKHIKTKRINIPKVHHLTFIASATLTVIREALLSRQKVTIIALGPLTALIMVLALPFRRRIKLVSYQPELHEDRLGPIFNIHKWISHKVDLFIDVDPQRLAIRKKRFGMKFRNEGWLPNFILDLPEMKTIQVKKDDTINLVYGGALSEEHGIDSFLRIFCELRTQKMFVHIYPIVHTGQKERLAKFKEEFTESKGVIWHSEKDRLTFLSEISAYDVGLCSYPWVKISDNGNKSENLNSKYAAPTKIYDYLSRGLFVISGTHPTLSELESSGLAFLYDYNDPQSLTNVLKNLWNIVQHDSARTSRIKIASSRFDIKPFINKIMFQIT